MIVIVEGIDRVGKTTLCEKLNKKGFVTLKDDIALLSGMKREIKSNCSVAKLDTTFLFLEQLHNQGVNVVVDRLHLTEMVYGKCDRQGYTCDHIIKDLEAEFFEKMGLNAVLVLVEATNIDEANERAEKDLTRHANLFKAYYQLSPMIKMRTTFPELDRTVKSICALSNSDVVYDFYLASPFFRPDQVEREERIKERLRELGYKVFSPKEDTFLEGDSSLADQHMTFAANCDAIKNSTAVFAITDTKDMGTIWEAGYAYGINKPIIYFAETLGDNPFNLMLAQSGNLVLTDSKQVNRDNIDQILNNPTKRIPYGGVIE